MKLALSKQYSPLLLALIMGLLPCGAVDTIRHADDQALAGRQWEVLDLRFEVENAPANPVDVPFSAVLQGEGGDRLEVPGFYNGDREYLIRFTPSSVGTWTYETRSTLAALNGLSGKLEVQEAKAGRKGGIVLNEESSREFQYQNGEPYYPIAFEADWLFALDAENAEGIPVTQRFIDQLSKDGFNQIVMNVFAYDVR